MRPVAALLLGLAAAGSARALEPQASCVLADDMDKIITREEAAASGGGFGVDALPSALPNGFALTEAYPGGVVVQALTHCPTGQYVLSLIREDREEAVLERFNAMMADSRGYSLEEISAELQRLGAFSRRGSGGIGGCDCAAVYGL